MRRVNYDYSLLEGEIKSETDSEVTFPAIIAREMVQDYGGKGRLALKAADELEKAAWTADHRWVIVGKHPDTALLVRPSDINGRLENPEFVKNLMDPKTKRPMDRGIRADVVLFKKTLPAGFVDELKSGKNRDVSIGFVSEDDPTPGEWRGQHYDYVQRDIFIDHLAAGIPRGRCPSPYCGLGVDALLQEEDAGDCPITAEIRLIGLHESCKLLAAAYGQDAIDVLRGGRERIVEVDADEVTRSRELIRDIKRLRSRSIG